ncbi:MULTISPECIES: dipeptide ABC transporter ATP-binding protein [Symbiopectobacterium]|uniref:dipeptide ABC transporter ATP-binding protein n=1 Tax=Candidatus Symbiopectobacterium sp. PLON1 TaxID=2794575 RepID=UPI001A1DCD4F|nr:MULTISPECIES: dipeptide ABC transporter ATP-binding protein [Symbiopectobacterium]MBG6247692.1 dipeptide ABC transporter ATP-binding protein [Candidatus Symbiopectobacterium sp. PLON1]MBT9428954.1 dipeptide ABC transporter ATP-binding protein [Candidatus Symbiopectobacterium endolongispinus]
MISHAPVREAADTTLILPEQQILSVRSLGVRFHAQREPVSVIHDLSLTVARGETLAIVGESGSGKSVTALAIMRLIEQAGGDIHHGEIMFRRRNGHILDVTTASQREMRRLRGADMAMVFQEPMTSLNPVFPVGEQIAESIRLHQGMSARDAKAETLRMLDLVRIPEAKSVLGRYPHQLSGGMRQRIMIAMALSCKPTLLIADEPTTALDVTIQAQILQLIQLLQREMAMAVIFITHDMGVLAEVADRVLVMNNGHCVETAGVSEIFATPQHVYTRALLAAVPTLGEMRGRSEPAPFSLHLTDAQGQAIAPQAVVGGASASLPEPSMPVLQVRDLVTRFPLRRGILNRVTHQVHAVEHISFDLYPGETLSLVGESGCGKSTAARALLQLVPGQRGTITFAGERIEGLGSEALHRIRRNIQLIFQDPYASLDPRLTVGFSIMEPLLVHKVMDKQAAEVRVAQLLKRVGLLPEHAGRYPHEFSGGQRQRICIARALALNPKVVIADEAVSALDVSIRAQIVNLMMELQQEYGIAFLFISHDMAVVERISHRVAVMYLGQIVEIGPRQAVFENPQHPYTRKLMAAVPIADPGRRHHRHALLADDIPSPVRALGDEPTIVPLIEVGERHYVAHHAIAGAY